jgi:Ala-tRNA(Pro) deacylase
MWLVVLPEDQKVDLRRLAEILGAGRFGFASPERLDTYLGVIPGAVTPFAVVNDTAGVVTVVLEKGLLDADPLHFHPLDNSLTTAISPDDLLRFLDETGHPVTVLDSADL